VIRNRCAAALTMARRFVADRSAPNRMVLATGLNGGAPVWKTIVPEQPPARPTPDAVFEVMRRENPTIFYGVPTLYAAMLEDEKGVQQYPDGSLRVVDVAEAGENSLLVHDAGPAQTSLAFALSRITFESHGAVPLGVFRAIDRPSYEGLLTQQVKEAMAKPEVKAELKADAPAKDGSRSFTGTLTISSPSRLM